MNIFSLALRRLPRLLVTVLLVCTSVFLIVALLPGNLAVRILGPDNATPENIKPVEADLGLDQPLPLRYLGWLGHVLTGDFGFSYVHNLPAGAEIAQRLPVTLELLVIATIVSLAVSLPLGILAAFRSNRFVDRLISVATFVLLAVPSSRSSARTSSSSRCRWGCSPSRPVRAWRGPSRSPPWPGTSSLPPGRAARGTGAS